MLPKAPHSWPGDLEDVRKSTPSPFRDLLAVDTFSLPSWPKAFQNPDAGAKCLLHQGKDSCLPSRQDTNPCFSAAQLEHVSRGVCVFRTALAEPVGQHRASLRGRRGSRRSAGHAASDPRCSREPSWHGCKNMFPTDHTSKHVPHELHDSYVIWGLGAEISAFF